MLSLQKELLEGEEDKEKEPFPSSEYCQPFCVNLVGEKALQQWHPSL